MGANIQSTLCDCFEKSHKTAPSKQRFSFQNPIEITLTAKNKQKNEKTSNFAQENGLTANVAQKIKEAHKAVLWHSSSKNPKKQQISLQSFNVIRILGKGASGKVLLVKRVDEPHNNYRLYAMKIIKKSEIMKYELSEHIKLEKEILQINRNRFLVKLKYAFQTPSNIYFVMEYMSGGDLHHLLKKYRNFPEELARFYVAEILLALEYLHNKMQVIYRDLKPENILLDGQGHIKLSDFGLSKKTSLDKTNTFAGTPEYIAPEVLLSVGHSYTVDFWSLGVVLYEMLSGKPPFSSYDGNLTTIVKLILENKPFYPIYFSAEATDLIAKLLKSHPKERLGSKGVEEIQKHPFFKGIQWDLLRKGQVNPPLNVEEKEISAQEIPSKIQESQPSQACINLSRISYNPDVTMDAAENGLDKSVDRSLVKSVEKSMLKSKYAGK